jgi:HEAT repeat protein
MQTNRKHFQVILFAGSLVATLLLGGAATVFAASGFSRDQLAQSSLTPLQMEIEKQRMRLSSTEVEERRDALVRLGSMHNPDASRVALSALGDPVATVRATAAGATLSLPSDESARGLIPLLSDKDEFVRREAAYALGKTGNRIAVPALVKLLLNDKLDSVRGAAAVALGEIRDETAVSPLSSILNPQLGLVVTKRRQKKKKSENPFVLRASARSLGQIGDRAGLPALIFALENEQGEADVRRESAIALGAVGDSSALPALREALMSPDPYLSQAAHQAIRKIQVSTSQ